MDVVVFAKWVPLGTPELGEDRRLVRGRDDGLDAADEFGIELALQLTERDGGEVTVVTMGPEGAAAAIQRALAMGAHRGVLVTDDALAGADALATARVLAAAARRQPFDLVIGGVESSDGYTGTVPSTVAELLDLPSVTFARRVDVADGEIRAERQTAVGYDEVTCALPALVTLTAGATEPRYPSVKGIMQAKSKPLDRLGLADLGLAAGDLAPSQSVRAVEPAPEKPGGEIVEAGEDAIARIADLLAEAKVI
ncbi:MAG: electron transfer flavoprotein subunit beta/FixA family protein [Actinomycetota bacterium]